MKTFNELKSDIGDKSYKAGLKELIVSLKEIVGSIDNDTMDEKSELEDKVIDLLKRADKMLTSSDNKTINIEKILTSIWKCKIITGENQSSDFKNALTHFVEGIYKDSFHFFLELIQNADDASKDSRYGRLHIVLTKDKKIQFKYDDRGFNFSDLYAITSLGNSTKKAQLNDNAEIGEKGIGFKSIFAIANKVTIKSKYFTFSIEADKNNLQNTLVPSEIKLDHTMMENQDVEIDDKLAKDYTTIVTLVLRTDLEENKNFWNDIDNWMKSNVQCKDYANPFMFLKNIKMVSYKNENDNDEVSEPIKIERERISDEDCCFKETIGENVYLVYKKNIEFGKEAILSRWPHLKKQLDDKDKDYYINREMQVAFPILSAKEQTKQASELMKGKFYSYLPTNITFNFPIYINLDVHLTASRGNISASDFAKGSLWNQQVLKELPRFLKEAYLYIINSHTNEKLEAQEILKDIREHLYNYITIETNIFDTTPKQITEKEDIDNQTKVIKGIGEQLKVFTKILIDECAIILSINNKFCNAENIRLIWDKVSLNPSFEKYEEIKIENLFTFMKKTQEKIEYPKSNQWNKLLSNILNAKTVVIDRPFDSYDIVVTEGGFKDYWENNNWDKTHKEKCICQLIEDIKNAKNVKNVKEISNGLSIIPIEDINNDGFSWRSLSECDEKTVFFHSNSPDVKEDEVNSIYVKQFKEGELGKVNRNLESLLSECYKISRYNLGEYYKKCIGELDWSDPQCGNLFINKTFKYYRIDENCYNIKEQLPTVKKYFKKFILPWEGYFEYVKGEDICESYIDFLIEEDNDLKIWDIDKKYEIFTQSDKVKYVKYLMWLGIKYKPEVESDLNDNSNKQIDKYTLRLINSEKCSKKITVNEFNRKLEIENNSLCEYLIKLLNNIADILSKECLKKIFEQMLSSQEYVLLDKNIIKTINNSIQDLHITASEQPQIKDSKIYLISTENIDNISKKIGYIHQKSSNTLIDTIINSFWYTGKDFIKNLRMLKILNLTFFGTKYEFWYKWGNKEDQDALELTLDAFLSCYKELVGEEKLGKLMKKGYKVVGLEKCDTINEELLLFLNNIGIDNIENIDSIKWKVAQVNNEQMIDPVISFDNNNHTEKIRYLVRQPKRHPKSGVIIIVLEQILNYRLSSIQKKEIEDYFGELEENTPIVIQSNTMGDHKYCRGVFFEYHKENVLQAQKSIQSIWDNDLLNNLCSPYRLSNNEIMEGYGYTCPICGEKSKAALSGLKFRRFKQDNDKNPYLYVVSCLNCCTMLSYAKSIRILNFDEKMEEFDKCYCADDNHMKNHSQMMTVFLRVETWDGKVKEYTMKISYLNMVLYKKMTKI